MSWQRDVYGHTGLSSLFGQMPHRSLEIEFGPRSSDELFFPHCQQKKQAYCVVILYRERSCFLAHSLKKLAEFFTVKPAITRFFFTPRIREIKGSSWVVFEDVPLNAEIENSLRPAEYIICDRRSTAFHDGLQHGVDIPWLNVFGLNLSQVGFNVIFDPGPNDVRMFPATKNDSFKILIGEPSHRPSVFLGLDFGKGLTLALLLLTSHVMAKGYLG